MKKKLHYFVKLKKHNKRRLSKNFQWFIVFVFFSTTAFSQVTISPWKMNKGAGAINFTIPNHGNPSAFSKMNIPDTADSNWTDAPINSNGEINFSERSILSRCLQQLDFTYFQTFISIPTGFTINDLNVSFSAADDGARAYIFNSTHPNGAYIGEIGLGGIGTSTNYASLAKAGETNKLVIVQFDSCPTGNNLTGAKVNVNGQAAPINAGGCTTSNFFWSNSPSIVVGSGNQIYQGTINGIGYKYHSSQQINTTSYLFGHAKFPSEYNIPNQTSIRNDLATQNKLVFDQPMTNPVLVFASIGGGQPSPTVSIQFHNNFSVVWAESSTTTADLSAKRVTGTEGNIIVRFDGTFSEIKFDYLNAESWVNFAFGADFSTNYPDTIAPSLILNGAANENVNFGTTYTDSGATATDNCDTNPAVLISGTVNTNIPGTHTLTYTAVDASGNTSAPITRTVNIIDPVPVVITQNITVSLDGNGNASFTPAQIDNGSSSVVGLSGLALDTTSFGCSNIGANTVTLTATSTLGKSASATAIVTVVDTIPPVTTKPADITVNTDNGLCGAAVNFAATATDNCGTATITYDIQPGSIFGVGTTTVTYEAVDASGNRVETSFEVTVKDNISPTITAPSNISVNATSALGAVVTYTAPVGEDNCTASTTLIDGPASGATFPIGVTTVTHQVKDEANNTAQASFTVTVTGLPPQIECPENITIDTDPGLRNAIVAFAATETVGIPESTITYSHQPGSSFPLGTTTVTATATNAVGSTSCTFIVTVVDNEKPTVVTKDIIVQLDTNGNVNITPEQINNGSTDNFDIATLELNNTAFTCANLGTNTVTLTVTDVNGNSAFANAIITVNDDMAPTVITQPISVSLDANGSAIITAEQINNISTDNCTIESMSLDIYSFTCANVGENTVTLTVTDTSGNKASKTAIVTVADNTPPTVITQPITVNLDANGNTSITAAQINNNSKDNCAIAEVKIDKTDFTCANLGPNTVTLTVTDVNGNTANATAVVTVKDAITPTVITKPISVSLDTDGNAIITAAQINNNSTDNCTIESLSLDIYSFTCANVGENTVTLTATDTSGNKASKTAIVTVSDNIAPTVITQNFTLELDASGYGAITTANIDNGSNDACGIASMTLDKTSFDCTNVGDNTVTLTVTDNNGNTSILTAIVNVVDIISPEIIASLDQHYYKGKAKKHEFIANFSATDECTVVTTGVIEIPNLVNPQLYFKTIKKNHHNHHDKDHKHDKKCDHDNNDDDRHGKHTHKKGYGHHKHHDKGHKHDRKCDHNDNDDDKYGHHKSRESEKEEIKINFKKNRIEIKSSNPQALYDSIMLNGGFKVESGDLIKFKESKNHHKHHDKYHKHKGHSHHNNGKHNGHNHKDSFKLTIKNGKIYSVNACSLILAVTAIDPSGNTTVVRRTIGETVAASIEDDFKEIILKDVSVYPNPTRGAFQVKLINFNSDTEIYLVDINGKIIERKSVKANNVSRDIQMNKSNLPNGVYLLKIISNEKTDTKKIIIQK